MTNLKSLASRAVALMGAFTAFGLLVDLGAKRWLL